MVNRRLGWFILILSLAISSGCSVYRQTVPGYCVGKGFYESRSDKEPINFLRLRQTPPAAYRLDERDVLGIYIEGVLGKREEPPPVHFPEAGDTPPAIGYPVPIREDGTISLPLIQSLDIRGLTLAQAEQKIRRAYLERKILRADRDRIIVTLMRPRTYHVLVVREDGGGVTAGNIGNLSPERLAFAEMFANTRGGQSHAIELRAYENDVLHALSETGGMPGNDAISEVIILRGGFANAEERDYFMKAMNGDVPVELLSRPGVIRIPLRLGPNDPLPQITERDIILHTGDVVFVKSRESEVFYTGGLLQGGQYPIPRDYDIDVLQAIAMTGGNFASATGSTNNSFLGGRSVGAIFPATRVIVLREMCGEQVPIEIDLRRAMVDPEERITIQPGDFITLEYRPIELVGNILVTSFQINWFLNR